eukprot:3295846-Rhodomonas_salina.3
MLRSTRNNLSLFFVVLALLPTAKGQATRLSLISPPGRAIARQAFEEQPIVQLQDSSNQPVISSQQISVVETSGPSNVVIRGTTTIAAANGTATFTDLTMNTPGDGFVLTFFFDDLGILATASTVASGFFVNQRQLSSYRSYQRHLPFSTAGELRRQHSGTTALYQPSLCCASTTRCPVLTFTMLLPAGLPYGGGCLGNGGRDQPRYDPTENSAAWPPPPPQNLVLILAMLLPVFPALRISGGITDSSCCRHSDCLGTLDPRP